MIHDGWREGRGIAGLGGLWTGGGKGRGIARLEGCGRVEGGEGYC